VADNLGDDLRKVVDFARQEATRLEHNYVGTEHLLLGLVRHERTAASQVLKRLGVDLELLRSAVEFIVGRGDQTLPDDVGLTPRAQNAIELAKQEAQNLGHATVNAEHVLLGLLRERESVAAGVLESFRVTLEDVRAQVTGSALRQFGTSLPVPGDVPVVAREPQITRVVEVLLRHSGNNPVLVGGHGGGRMDVVRGLAARVEEAQVPSLTKIAEVLQVVPDMEQLPEETLAALLSSILNSGVRVLGTATPAGFDAMSARNRLVAELFEPVLVPEPSVEDTKPGVASSDDALKRTFAPQVAEVLLRVVGENTSAKPTRALLIFSPAGAHVTQFTQSLAHILFGSAAALVELDLSGDVGRLATYPPGRVWFYPSNHTSVADALRHRPASVLRLSHAERANPPAIDLAEYILRTGQVTDPLGRLLDLTRAAIVVTSTRGAQLDPRLLRLLPTQIQLTRGWSRQDR
jgi:ATP-dependent Clp protease ATP-binding subunit ClpA